MGIFSSPWCSRCDRQHSMARPLQLQIVERARALIADESHWCRGELARDANGMGVCPMSDEAIKRCGLGALIMAAYRIIPDHRSGLRSCYQGHASPARQRHTRQCKRSKGPCCGARLVRRSHCSGVVRRRSQITMARLSIERVGPPPGCEPTNFTA
jgi:hypothetical protein